MDNIIEIVAENLKELREKRKMSLDAVAKLTGVSKSMLGQIERGEVSPSISTLWKLASGLKLSFSELINRPQKDYEIVDTKRLQPLVEDDGRFRNYPVVPFDSVRRFELYTIEIDADGRRQSEPHPSGAQEFITVFSGQMTVTVSGESFILESGNTFHFLADRQHAYHNSGADLCRLSMVIYYPQ
jgi:transcriptional regulator with XRE-family HTH domain